MWKPISYENFWQWFSRIKFNNSEDRDIHLEWLKKEFPKMNIKKSGDIWIVIAPIILPIKQKI